ncbi:MAG: SDR family oxidoreductase [Chloroflexota bacterium]
MKTVLIAGATGYLGRYAVHAFKAAGYRVRVLARDEKKLAEQGHALAPAIADQVDEVHLGDVTQPETLRGIANGVDIVFSSISLMAAKNGLKWHDVDYMGNVNLLNEAKAAGVEKFIFISVFNAAHLMHVPIVKAHEDFAAELAASGLRYTVIRPTGYFSDLGAFLDMARSGRVYLLGNGKQRINPIHGADLAQVSVNAVEMTETDINVGGTEAFTWDEIAKLALHTIGTKPQITHLPIPMLRLGLGVLRPFMWHNTQLWDFFVSSAALTSVAPQTGTHRLADHYVALAAQTD